MATILKNNIFENFCPSSPERPKKAEKAGRPLKLTEIPP